MLLIVFMSTLGCERGRSEALDYVKSHVSFDCFRVELQAKFCCCENGGYFYEKITSLGETQTYGHYLFSPEGFEMFELHLNELPKIYSLAIDELMSKGLNCCKN